jgi:arylsulfatase
MDWNRWWVEHIFLLVPAQQYVGQFIATFKDFHRARSPAAFRSTTC